MVQKKNFPSRFYDMVLEKELVSIFSHSFSLLMPNILFSCRNCLLPYISCAGFEQGCTVDVVLGAGGMSISSVNI